MGERGGLDLVFLSITRSPTSRVHQTLEARRARTLITVTSTSIAATRFVALASPFVGHLNHRENFFTAAAGRGLSRS
jgi:hypothetical protein